MAAQSFPNTADAVAAARRFTLDHVSGLTADVADELAVMVSELTTNSIRHTGTPFTVEVDQAVHTIYVAVTDSGPGEPAVRSPDPSETSGRGLQIVRALAHEWGIKRRAKERGKTVWFTLRY